SKTPPNRPPYDLNSHGFNLFRSPNQRTFAWQQGTKCLVTGNSAKDFVIVPWVFGLLRRLYLNQIKIVDHSSIWSDLAIACKEIIYGHFAHLGDDLFWVLGLCSVYGLKIMHRRRINASLRHCRHRLMDIKEALRPGTSRVVA